VGSKDFLFEPGLSHPPTRLKAYKEENYTIAGTCNLDNTLDLVNDEFIIDSNTIEDLLTNQNEEWDDKIFMIDTDGSRAIKSAIFNPIVSTGVNTGTTPLKLIDAGANFAGDGVAVDMQVLNITEGTITYVSAIDSGTTLSLDDDIFTSSGDTYRVIDGPFVYNEIFFNFNVLSRWLGGLPNSVVKYFGSGNDNFESELSTDDTETVFPIADKIIIHDTELSDDGNNYDPGAGEYTIPSDGLYAFEALTIAGYGGDLGTEQITNGTFATDTFWNKSIGWSINGGTANVSLTNNASNSITQFLSLTADTFYEFSFEILNYQNGTVIVSLIDGGTTYYNETFTGNQIVTVLVNTDGLSALTPTILFSGRNEGNGVQFSIDNVTLKPYPKFSVTTKIIHSTSGGDPVVGPINTFSETFSVRVNPNLGLQIRNLLNSSGSFGAFAGDKVQVFIDITEEEGVNNSFTIRNGSEFKSTLVHRS